MGSGDEEDVSKRRPATSARMIAMLTAAAALASVVCVGGWEGVETWAAFSECGADFLYGKTESWIGTFLYGTKYET